MFLLMVASIFVSLQNIEGVYDYLRPGMSSELSNNKREQGIQDFARGILNEYTNSDEKRITYSVPHRDYNFLQQHKIGENDHYFRNNYQDFSGSMPIESKSNINNAKRFIANIPKTMYGSPNIGQIKTLTHHHHIPFVQYLQNSESQKKYTNNVKKVLPQFIPYLMNANHNIASQLSFRNSEEKYGLPAKVNFVPQRDAHYRKRPIFHNSQSISNVMETHDQNIKPVEPLGNFQYDFGSQKTHTPQVEVNINPGLENLAQPIGTQNSVSPVITKHIYFHAPPPDIEETPVKPTPPKKSYKIIFIKVPGQESKNIEEIMAYNSLGSIEDKTLIYVLSNNSKESSHLVVPSYKPTDHEVLFVKYNSNHSFASDDNLIEQDDGIYQRKW